MAIQQNGNPIQAASFLRKTVTGTLWLTVGSVVSKVLLALAFIILARIITAKEYGEYSILKSTIDNFLVFASMGIGLTATKYISELKSINKQRASSILGTALLAVLTAGLIIATMLFFFSDYISIQIFKAVSLRRLIFFVALILVLTAVNSVQMGALLGLQSFKSISIANIFQGVFLFLGLTAGGYFFAVPGAIIGNLIAMLLFLIITQFYLVRECRKQGIFISLYQWKKNLKTIYKFAIPSSLSTIITAITVWLLNVLLVNQFNGFVELGIYSATIIFSLAIQMLNGSLSNVLLPMYLSNETGITAKKEFFNYFSAWIISIMLALPLIVFPEIVSSMLGEKYPKAQVIIILGLTLFSTLFIAYKQGISRDLIIKNKMWLSVFSMGQWSLTTYIAFLYLKDYGAVGFALSFFIGFILNYLVFIPYFIYMKICPAYIFTDKNIVFIWLLLAALIILPNLFNGFFVRISLSLILTGLLGLCLFKLYKKYALVNTINRD